MGVECYFSVLTKNQSPRAMYQPNCSGGLLHPFCHILSNDFQNIRPFRTHPELIRKSVVYNGRKREKPAETRNSCPAGLTKSLLSQTHFIGRKPVRLYRPRYSVWICPLQKSWNWKHIRFMY